MNEREAMTDLAAIRSECVEVMARTWWDSTRDTTLDWWPWERLVHEDADGYIVTRYRKHAATTLAALEAASHTAECDECGGTGFTPCDADDPEAIGDGWHEAPSDRFCPARCDSGRVVLGGLLLALVGEQVGWLEGPAFTRHGYVLNIERVGTDNTVPVFRARSMEEKT